MFTSSMTGTSVRTPTVVARAAGDSVPKRETATATCLDNAVMENFFGLLQGLSPMQYRKKFYNAAQTCVQ